MSRLPTPPHSHRQAACSPPSLILPSPLGFMTQTRLLGSASKIGEPPTLCASTTLWPCCCRTPASWWLAQRIVGIRLRGYGVCVCGCLLCAGHGRDVLHAEAGIPWIMRTTCSYASPLQCMLTSALTHACDCVHEQRVAQNDVMLAC